jgi:hypothetical protein
LKYHISGKKSNLFFCAESATVNRVTESVNPVPFLGKGFHLRNHAESLKHNGNGCKTYGKVFLLWALG